MYIYMQAYTYTHIKKKMSAIKYYYFYNYFQLKLASHPTQTAYIISPSSKNKRTHIHSDPKAAKKASSRFGAAACESQLLLLLLLRSSHPLFCSTPSFFPSSAHRKLDSAAAAAECKLANICNFSFSSASAVSFRLKWIGQEVVEASGIISEDSHRDQCSSFPSVGRLTGWLTDWPNELLSITWSVWDRAFLIVLSS